MTERQRRTLGWLNRQPWVSDRLYFRLADRWSRRPASRAREGDADWRVQLQEQGTWIRATRLQYTQMADHKRSIGVPRLNWDPAEALTR